MARVIVAAELPDAGGAVATAAALAVEAAGRAAGAVAFIEVGGGRRGPTILASEPARVLETRLREAGLSCSARGRLAWATIHPGDGWLEEAQRAVALLGHDDDAVICLPPSLLGAAIESSELGVKAVMLRAELPGQRALAALSVAELTARGLRVKIAARAPGRVGTRRALAGIEPGGEPSRRAAQQVRGLLGRRAQPAGPIQRGRLAAETGQALPLVLGGVMVLVFATLLLAALGGAVTGKSRVQRAADLAAISVARSMRDDFDRLFVPAARPDGSPNPIHLSKAVYLDRARRAGEQAARRNGVGDGRLELEFPDAGSFAPLRVRAAIAAELDTPGRLPQLPVAAHAEAEAVPAASPAASPTGPAIASGGGYAGRLEYRQGEGMRPDVAAAFDRLASAAVADGVSLLINDGFRSDAEQAELWAQNPDPRWVAPPGTSLHRCATELDLGPPAAYAWLAANASRFGFVQRYSWEAWHYGFVAGPPPCSAAGDAVGPVDSSEPPAGSEPDGRGDQLNLPAFVPARFREAIATAAQRWDVSGALLAAQLMAESNFNPFAVSPAGAAGIAQFMPATAAAYGLDDPFDAVAAIDAQAHLMADLLARFGEPSLALAAYNAGPAPVAACFCVPDYPETQAYVARILGLLDGADVSLAGGPPALEVRLVD